MEHAPKLVFDIESKNVTYAGLRIPVRPYACG